MLYPIGIQKFEKLRDGGYVYVDKTAHIHELATKGCYYFLSRPRRFGKSLLVSTMEAYFKGQRDLFHGLAIEKLEKDWTEHPVLHLDLSGQSNTDIAKLDEVLDYHLGLWEKSFGVAAKGDVSIRFRRVIDAAHACTGEKVVILIDEYDKPLLDNLTNPEAQNQFMDRLQGFYSVMKAKDGDIRFGFLTGVTKIGKISIFSGLNNLQDISMDSRYADICGITEEELHGMFDESIQELSLENMCRWSVAQAMAGWTFYFKPTSMCMSWS